MRRAHADGRAAGRRPGRAADVGGADAIGVVAQDSPASGEAAAAKGVFWSGYDSDQSANFPDVWLSAATYNWATYEIPRVKAALDGTWVAGNYYGSLADGHVVLAPLGKSVSAETRALIAEKTKEVVADSGVMFKGPLKDNTGKEVLADGEQATYEQLMGMNFLVEGIDGTIPK